MQQRHIHVRRGDRYASVREPVQLGAHRRLASRPGLDQDARQPPLQTSELL